MPDRPNLHQATEADDRDVIEEELSLLVRRAAHALHPKEAFADAAAAAQSDVADSRADRLALLGGIEALRAALEEQATVLVRSLGRSPAPVTYADLGAAVGITRQAARTRWPGALPDAKPGRPPLPPLHTEEILLEQALSAWPEIADPDAMGEGVPCQVWHPGPDSDAGDRASWSWIPGRITDRTDYNEWLVELTDEETCFRDISEIRPLDPARPAAGYITAVVDGLGHLGVPVLDSWTQEDDGRMEGLVEVQDDETGALGAAWNADEGWIRLWRHGPHQPGAFSKYDNTEQLAAADESATTVVRMIAQAAGHDPDQSALL